MSILMYLIVYLSLAVFLYAVLSKVRNYLNMPIHVRWELYPVAHEAGARATYGGSYLEDEGWWHKERKSSLVNELKVMVPEMLFLHAAHKHNKPLWNCSFPFHFGMYLMFGAMCLFAFVGILHIDPATSWFFGALPMGIAKIILPIGIFLGLIGAFLLWRRRVNDEGLKVYTTNEHIFNLFLFMGAFALWALVWLTTKYSVMVYLFFGCVFSPSDFSLAAYLFAGAGSFTIFLFQLHIIVMFLVMAYVPVTHMAHFFMKYFLYHDIRWGDEPNIDNPKIQEKIHEVLNYPVSWSAGHIRGDGKKTWAEVAMHNPVEDAKNDAKKDKE